MQQAKTDRSGNVAIIDAPKAQPARSWQEVRERAVADQLRVHRVAGVDITTAQAEAMADSELQAVEAYRREAVKSPKKPTRKATPATRETVQQQVESLGLRQRQAPAAKAPNAGAIDVSSMKAMKGVVEAERWSKAIDRVAVIVAAGTVKTTSVHQAIDQTDSPELARDFMRLWANYHIGRYAESRHNRFRGMSEKDAAKSFIRAVYDICDRSTGRFGPWWVR